MDGACLEHGASLARMEGKMHHFVKRACLVMGSLGALAVAAPAYAGCGDTAGVKPSVWQGDSKDLFHRESMTDTSIVGLWSFQFLAGSTMVDFGYSAWHSDGTEIMNSGGRSPATENFCLGVWQQTGPSRYKLNHWALSYDTSGTLNAFVNIREDVIVSGQAYSGTFTLDVYDPKTKAALQHIGGRVVAKRVTINSGI
jgi:hypothetical protein